MFDAGKPAKTDSEQKIPHAPVVENVLLYVQYPYVLVPQHGTLIQVQYYTGTSTGCLQVNGCLLLQISGGHD